MSQNNDFVYPIFLRNINYLEKSNFPQPLFLGKIKYSIKTVFWWNVIFPNEFHQLPQDFPHFHNKLLIKCHKSKFGVILTNLARTRNLKIKKCDERYKNLCIKFNILRIVLWSFYKSAAKASSFIKKLKLFSYFSSCHYCTHYMCHYPLHTLMFFPQFPIINYNFDLKKTKLKMFKIIAKWLITIFQI